MTSAESSLALKPQSATPDPAPVLTAANSVHGGPATADLRSVPPRRLPRPVAVVIAVLVLGSAFYGISSWRDARNAYAASMGAYAPPPTEVSAVVVAIQDMPIAIRSVGSLTAVDEVVLAPEVGGRVSDVLFEAGDAVAAGAVLLRLRDTTEQAQLASAQAQQRFAQLQLERSQKLAPAGTESRQSLQQREVENEQAEAAVALIKAAIAQKTITAPFAGVLGLREVNPGAFVSAGQTIATLTALDTLHVNFNVPQQDLPKLLVGGDVTVSTDVFPGRSFAAVISAIDPSISADTRNVTVQATLDNKDASLRPGLFVNVGVNLPAKAGTILVPNTAIQSSASGDMAFLIKDGMAAIVPVTLGARLDGQVEVTSGLAAGDTLITTGQLRVRPGAPVTIADPNAPPAAPAW